MAGTKKEKLENYLGKFLASGDIEGAAVVTRDGLLVASALSEKIDAETLAAMTATMTGAAETAMHELKKKEVVRVIVETADTKLITTGAGEDMILVCMVGAKAKLGLILMSMKKTAQLISKEVGK
jgi:predicted regulator of Ras-like GTPase activity (Roadblock/LC7/MglB family)